MSISNLLTTFSLLLLTTSSVAQQTPLQSFIECFQNQISPSTELLIYTQNSTSYTSILESAAQNLRFLVSPSYNRPAAIVTVTAESHVSATVVCAHAHGLQIRTRSGGHDYEAMSYVSANESRPAHPQFVVLDLAALRRVDVDNYSRTAWVQAGATVGEVYYYVFTRTNGTGAFPAAICPTVGVGGHISGGGIGLLTRKYGLAADNMVDARVVGIDGRVLDRKAMGEDLYWAIRGGGAASFGVVVAYQIKIVDVPPVVTAFNVYKNLRQNATQLVTRWQEIAHNFSENLFIRVVARAANDPQSEGNMTIQATFNSYFLGTRGELLDIMASSFPELGLTANVCTEMSWLQSILFFNYMSGKGVEALLNRSPMFNTSFKAKSDFVTTPITEDQWETIWRYLMEAKDQPMMMIMEPFGGRMSEISPTETPFPHREGNLYNIQYYMPWSGANAQVTRKHLNWMKDMYEFMTPYVSKNPRGAYYNYKDMDLGRIADEGVVSYESARVWGEMYFKSNFKRLAYVKGKVDPHNFFRNEQSIPPLIA